LKIVITRYSTYNMAKCECSSGGCGWLTIDQRRLKRNVREHIALHKSHKTGGEAEIEHIDAREKPAASTAQ